MINVSEVVTSPEFAQNFTIQRSTGSWSNGKWVSVTTPVQGFGVISVATPDDVVMQKEGDVIKGDMVFHSQQPIYETSQEAGRSSDILVWNNINWRVLTLGNWSDYGYYRAIAVRLSAAS